MELKNAIRSGRCWYVGSDKVRSKGRVGSGSGNVRGRLWPIIKLSDGDLQCE